MVGILRHFLLRGLLLSRGINDMRKHISIAVFLSVVLSALVLVVAKRQTRAGLQTAAASRTESLREKAKLNGSYSISARPKPMRRYNDGKTLAQASSFIVVATVESSNAQLLSRAENFIVTHFQIKVSNVLKGSQQPNQVLTLRVPGGRVQFEDGTSAEVKMPDFWKQPEVGKSYVFFLEQRHAGHFVLHGGPQGLFELTGEGRVKPQVRAEDQLMQNYENKDVDSFVSEIRKAVGQ